MNNNTNTSTCLVFGIIGLVLSTFGAICFGVYCSIPGLALGLVGLIMSINVKKQTMNQQGNSAFVVSLLAIIFAALFTIGCAACDIGGYGCKGIVGGSCSAVSDARDISSLFD